MSRTQTAEEVQQQYIDKMGNELGTHFYALYNELAWLYVKWGEYVELFGQNESRVNLLNDAANQFFRIVQDTLFEDTILHIARMTDPPKTAGKDNLTICRLIELIDDKVVYAKLDELITVAKDKTEFCRDWRNRHIAHRDLKLALKFGAEPLKSASRMKVKEALESISNVLNEVYSYFFQSIIYFEGVGSIDGAVSLLYIISDGLRAQNEKQQRLESGNPRSEDFEPYDI